MKNVVHVKCNYEINFLTAKIFKVQFRFNTRLLAHNQRKVNFYRTRNRCIYLHMYTLITTQTQPECFLVHFYPSPPLLLIFESLSVSMQ